MSPKVQEISGQLAAELAPKKKSLSTSELKKLIDEGGRIMARLERAGFTKLAERLKQIKHVIAEQADLQFEAAEDHTYEARLFEAKVSAKSFEREIVDMPKVMAEMVEFLSHCSFSLEKLDVLCPDAEEKGLLKREQTGNRRVKIQAKQPKLKVAA